jgi:hypothetical protein
MRSTVGEKAKIGEFQPNPGNLFKEDLLMSVSRLGPLNCLFYDIPFPLDKCFSFVFAVVVVAVVVVVWPKKGS